MEVLKDDEPLQCFAVAPGARFMLAVRVHVRPVMVVSLSPDIENRVLRQLLGPGDDPLYTSVAFSDDVRHAIVGEEDGFVNVWDLGGLSRAPKLRFKAHDDPVDAVAASEDFKLIAAGSCEGALSLFRASDGELLARFVGHRGQITAVTFWHNKFMASTSLDRSVRVWDLESGTEVALLVRHRAKVRSLQFSPNGRFLVSAGADGEAIVWDIEEKKVKTVIVAPGPLLVAGLSEDMQTVTTACERAVHKWDSGVSGSRFTSEIKVDEKMVGASFDSVSGALVGFTVTGKVHKF